MEKQTKAEKEKQKKVNKMIKENDILFGRLQDIYNIVCKNGVKMRMNQEEANKFYEKSVGDTQKYFLKHNLSIKDIQTLIEDKIICEPMSIFSSLLRQSIYANLDLARTKKWGKKFETIKFKEINSVLKSK